ncbi:MAG: hypothetical protein J6C43_05345 [Oscillospiraceae bacterium]|nr:hypothetical protein [Oscillospiraceae bacterium]
MEQLSVEDLECLLCLSSDAEETEAFLDAVAEVIAEKEKEHPTGRLPNVDDAWNEFQTLYQNHSSEHMPPDDDKEDDQEDQEEEDPIPAPRKSVSRQPRRARRSAFRRLWPIAATVLITVALTVGCMVGVQATGLNVFGALAEWTDEFFHFVPVPSDRDRIKNALKEQGIPEELAPAWVPEGFELEKIESLTHDGGSSITIEYVGTEGSLVIDINKYNNPIYLIDWDYQKDSPGADPFVSHERQFYILSNEGDTTATWSDGQALLINLWGNVSAKEMMYIISSIGG